MWQICSALELNPCARDIGKRRRRITATVDTVFQQYVDPDGSSDSRRMWTVMAYGPDLAGGERTYNEMIGKDKPNVRRGQKITIAIHPTDPGKYAMLLPEMAEYYGDADPFRGSGGFGGPGMGAGPGDFGTPTPEPGYQSQPSDTLGNRAESSREAGERRQQGPFYKE